MLVSALAGGVERRAALEGVPLNCWQARSKIDEYLADELPGSDRSMLEKHLGGCPTCPALYASIVGVTEALGTLRDPDSVIPPKLAERVRVTLEGLTRRTVGSVTGHGESRLSLPGRLGRGGRTRGGCHGAASVLVQATVIV